MADCMFYMQYQIITTEDFVSKGIGKLQVFIPTTDKTRLRDRLSLWVNLSSTLKSPQMVFGWNENL